MVKAAGDKAEAILEAALEFFVERGFHGTTVRDIAQRAHVNLAAGHYHFGSKETLYLEVLRAQFARLVKIMPSSATLVKRFFPYTDLSPAGTADFRG